MSVSVRCSSSADRYRDIITYENKGMALVPNIPFNEKSQMI